MSSSGRTDWFLFSIAAGLAVFGAVMVYSASAMMSLQETQNQTDLTYFYKQFGFTLAGIVLMVGVSRLDYRVLNNSYVVYGFLAITAVLLIVVLGFPAINGARRWIRFGGFSFQPSEIAKVALPVFLAYFLTKREGEIADLKRTVFPCVFALALIGALVLKGPDLGTTIVLCAIFSVVYFSAGARLRRGRRRLAASLRRLRYERRDGDAGDEDQCRTHAFHMCAVLFECCRAVVACGANLLVGIVVVTY